MSDSRQSLRAGIDIGGTFTDLVVYDDASGAFVVGKTLTTPDDPSIAIEIGLEETLSSAEAQMTALGQIIHGTTLVTNALIERKGALTALLASEGFRDSLEIGREHRYDLYDLQLEMPRPLVPRELRFGVPGRTLADGSTLPGHDLDEAYVERLARELDTAGIEAVAIAFLNSFANPELERRAREAVQRVAPEIRVSISSDVVPEIREYERTSTTVANVYVQARVERYLRDLEERLARAGFRGALLMLISSGALATVETAARFPVRLLESGPAGGALAAAAFGAAAGYEDLLSFDMGGTTAKFAVIARGEPLLAHGFEVDRRYRFKKGSGLPINLPVIEMIEIGAGGGSIARIDALGLLKVGPDSAGADPGPACYGRGGERPTVTDADLILGYLDPGFFLGGAMSLDVEAAREAIRRDVAEPLGLSVEEAAWGIHQIVNEVMAGAARVHTLERGGDPRRLPVFAFGGAGPVHGYRIAAALGSPRLIVPSGAGVMSAIGFLAAPIAFDFTRSFPGRLDALDWARVNGLLTEMEAEGTDLLASAGLRGRDVTHRRAAEMRYVGQGHEVRVPLPPGPLTPASVPILRQAFETEYLRLYGRLGPPVAVEAITWRVVSSGPRPDLRLSTAPEATGDAESARKGTRRAYVPEQGGMTDVPVYDRYRLGPGATFTGPVIVEERESTTVIGPGAAVSVDGEGNLTVEIKEGGEGGSLRSRGEEGEEGGEDDGASSRRAPALPQAAQRPPPSAQRPPQRSAPLERSDPPLDPVTLEVLWNRLLSVANEQQAALMRTAFSTVVRESQDLACGVFDTRGQMMAQSLTGTPGHINPMATGVRHLLAAYPPETLGPGDVLITNDPWMTSGQLNDFTVVTPVFRQGRIVGYFGNLCHAADIGGQVFSGEAHEIFEEGLRVPVTKLFDRSEPNQELLKIIRANVRLPDETVGDLYAQASCNDVGGWALLAMMDEFGLESVDPLAGEIIARSERALREAIRSVPDGVYRHEVWSDGFEEPIKIAVTVTVRGDEIDIDFAGSSSQSGRGINVVLNYTHGYASFALKAAIAPDVPHNQGAFRPVHVTAPLGSILNCVDPAAVAARHLIGHFVPSAIFGALAQALPERLLAGGADPIWLSVWRGEHPENGEPFMTAIFQVGGTGARATKDGLSTTGFPSGVAGVPAEVIEHLSALVQSRRELRTDSGGAGRTRGGLGQATEYWYRGDEPWSVSAMIDRTKFAAQGFAGGGPGALGLFEAEGEPLKPKTVISLAPGQRVLLAPPGGAGYGDPFQRPVDAVLADVVSGYVSLESAERDYGVVIRYVGMPEQLVRLSEDYAVDEEATARLRRSRDQATLPPPTSL